MTLPTHAVGNAESFFRDGVTAFRKSDYPAARTAFSESLKSQPNNPAALFNLGLVEYRAGHVGLGLGLWRKALAQSPDYSPARRALAWAETHTPRASLSRDSDTWDAFRSALLAPVPLSRYLGFSLLLFFLTGWLALRYFGERRRALLDEKPLPPMPLFPLLFSLLFTVSLLLVGAKVYDMTIVRGTVVADRVSVQTTPDKESASLFDLFEGIEVTVRQFNQGWMQVTYPGGLTGWVPQESIFISSQRIVP